MKHTRMILSVAVVALAMPLTSLAQFKQAVIATQSFHMAGTVASEPSADATHSATQATSHSAAQMVRTSDEVSTPSAQQTSMSLAQQQSGQEQARGSSHLRSTRHAATSSTSNTQNQMTADASDSNNLMNSPIMPLITILQSGLTRVSQQQNLFQQQLRDKLEELTSENKELKDQVHALIQSVHQLDRQVEASLATQTAAQAHAAASNTLRPESVGSALASPSTLSHSLYFVYGGMLLIVLLSLLTFLMVFKSRSARLTQTTPPKKRPSSGQTSEDEEEYDYMSSAEAIPVKFDLASAYQAMQDFKAAAHVLEDIIATGSPSQRDKAERMLAETKTMASRPTPSKSKSA